MKPVLSCIILVLFVAAAAAQQKPRYFTPVPSKNQVLRGSLAGNEGAVGLDAKKGEGGFQVVTVKSASPAERAGIRPGDVLVSINEKPLASLQQMDFYETLRKNPGETLRFIFRRNNQELNASLVVEPRKEVYPEEAQVPPTIGQPIFEGRALVQAAIAQRPEQPQSITVWLLFANRGAPIFGLDDAKFFILDGQGQQLRRVTVDELRYSIQLWVAQNWRGGNYPPPTPPPPQRRYTITGTETGTYTVTDLGTFGTVSGTSTGTYTVTQEPDYGQLGYMLGYSLGTAIRQRRDRKHNQKLLQQAQRALSEWDANYFKSQSPIIPGENRRGGMVYWSGSGRGIGPPLKLILFLTDPTTKAEEIVAFQFK